MGCCHGSVAENEFVISSNFKELQPNRPPPILQILNDTDQRIEETPIFGASKRTAFVFESKDKDNLEIN